MTVSAIALVITAAFVHASWNFLAKRAGGGVAFVWLFGVVSTGLYAPLAVTILIWQRPELNMITLSFMVGTGIIHTIYFLLLQQGYRAGDLSLIYPLARGTGPMIATIAAILFLGERPTLIVIAGGGLIAIGIFLFTVKSSQMEYFDRIRSVMYALFVGICIAGYTLWDKYAVSQLLISPILLDWSSNLTRSLLLMPLALQQRSQIKSEWYTHRREIIGVAFLCPLAYILVLTALVFSPVSYVAPAREISIVIGAAMGAKFLAEEDAVRRLLAASLIVLGAVAIAIG